MPSSDSLGVVRNAGTPAGHLADADDRRPVGELSSSTRRRITLAGRGGDRAGLRARARQLEALLSAHPEVVYRVMRAIVRTVHEIQRRISMQTAELTNYIYKQHGKY